MFHFDPLEVDVRIGMLDSWKKLPEEVAAREENQLVSENFSVFTNKSDITETLDSLDRFKSEHDIFIEEGIVQVQSFHVELSNYLLESVNYDEKRNVGARI